MRVLLLLRQRFRQAILRSICFTSSVIDGLERGYKGRLRRRIDDSGYHDGEEEYYRLYYGPRGHAAVPYRVYGHTVEYPAAAYPWEVYPVALEEEGEGEPDSHGYAPGHGRLEPRLGEYESEYPEGADPHCLHEPELVYALEYTHEHGVQYDHPYGRVGYHVHEVHGGVADLEYPRHKGLKLAPVPDVEARGGPPDPFGGG